MGLKKIIIVGGGGHAKVIIDTVQSGNLFQIEGIVDNKLKNGVNILGIPIIGDDDFLFEQSCYSEKYLLAIGIGAVRAPLKRKDIYDKYRNKNFDFANIIHNSAHISKGTIYEDGVQIFAGAVVGPQVKLGSNIVIYSGAVVEHDCEIASHCYISPGVLLSGNVQIDECSFIGIGASIVQGVKIGKGVTVGAGAVVLNDVNDGKIVAGVPAKEICA